MTRVLSNALSQLMFSFMLCLDILNQLQDFISGNVRDGSYKLWTTCKPTVSKETLDTAVVSEVSRATQQLHRLKVCQVNSKEYL